MQPLSTKLACYLSKHQCMKGKGKKKEEIEAETSKGPAVIQTVPDFIVMGSPASGFFFFFFFFF